MNRKNFEVSAKKLRYHCDPKKLGIKEDTRDIELSKKIIGQALAIASLKFGLEMKANGYNIFVTGPSNTGKKSIVEKYLKKYVEENKKLAKNLKDICFLYNFKNPDKPQPLILPKGKAIEFQSKIKKLLKNLKKNTATVLESEPFIKSVNNIKGLYLKEAAKLQTELKNEAEKRHIIISRSKDDSVSIYPKSLQDGSKPMTDEELKNLPVDIQKKIKENKLFIIQFIKVINARMKKMQVEFQEKIKDLEKVFMKQFVKILFEDFSDYQDIAKEYLSGLEKYIVDNVDKFKAAGKPQGMMVLGLGKSAEPPERYLEFQVNILVDNSRTEYLPIIFEKHPTFANLFGSIQPKSILMPADFTMIKAGSLLKANGGYLVVDALDLLINPGTWRKLQQTLKTRLLKIEDLTEYLGTGSNKGLNAEPIPIDLKVIVIGPPNLYRLLAIKDNNFLNIFKVKAEINSETNIGKNNVNKYVSFIATLCKKEGLLPFNKEAVARVIEYAVELTDSQKKLSLKFGKIKDLLKEADYWTRKDNNKIVSRSYVDKAIFKKNERNNSMQKAYQQYINQGTFFIDTTGKKIGEINALAVFGDIPSIFFGIPVKITAQSFLGSKGIISIQEVVKLTGKIFNSAIGVIQGWLSAKYGQKMLLPMSISISFEQQYGKIDGDSASAAELSVILSSLSGVPINQSLAITGSMNQKGEIQPIGGVNHKIEGFYDICKERGLTGDQGVIIPRSNLDDLMLREDVVRAVEQGEFHIYAISTIDEALRILTGISATKIHKLVEKRFKQANEDKKF